MKKILMMVLAGSMLLFGTTVFALTMDEAKVQIDKQAAEKNLSASDHSHAVATLQGLVDKGVPVEHAYRVVDASINHGIKGKDLSEVAKSVENTTPAARKDAAGVAADAIRHRYTVRETVQLTNSFGKAVEAGAQPGQASQVMTQGINKGHGAGSITAAMNTYAEQVRAGTPAGRAADTAARTMDRDRTMQQDRDMMHDRDHMGTGSGMDHGGMDHGAGMGPGAGPGTGGPRR